MKTKQNKAKQTKILEISLAALLLVLMVANIISAAADIPRIEPYVNDFASLMTSDQIVQLNVLCDSIENVTTYEIAIVTVPSTGGEDTVQFANKIGDQNGVGKKDQDNGIVVLWSLSNNKGGAIATGRGSESILNDAKVGEIGRASRHFFDEGNYSAGFIYIVNEINNVIVQSQNESAAALTGGENSNGDDGTGMIIVFSIISFSLVVMFIAIFLGNREDYGSNDEDKGYTKRKGKNGKYRYYSGTGRSYATAAAACAAAALISDNDDSDSDSDDSSSGGFSGGGSFGGGSFGGGGSHF